jgi:hypothetical protein
MIKFHGGENFRQIVVNHGINFKMVLKKKNPQFKAFLSSRCKPQNKRDSAWITHIQCYENTYIIR